jgi:tetratricopeptide (TPR) repeat protein
MSSRLRVYGTVAAACVAAAGLAAAVAWNGRGEAQPVAAVQTGPRQGAPPLALDFLVADRAEAVALQDAVRLYQDGRRGRALERFEDVLAGDPDSLYAAVGTAMARWPDGTLPALETLAGKHPESALVQLHLGLTQYWLRRERAATSSWQRALAVEPDSASAIRAESLLHPDMPEGRPFFVPSRAAPREIADLLPLAQLDELERLASDEGTAEAWIQYGVALQRAGRPVSAAGAFDRAVEADPQSVEAKAAAALIRFTKDDPAAAFSRLGPLAAANPDSAVVRFHLGLALLWLSQVEEARQQLEGAIAAAPESIYARQATQLLDRLSEAGAG